MLIAQITDCHIVEPGQLVADRVDTSEALQIAVEAVNSFDPAPDFVLATGDLVNDGSPAQYDRLMELLAPLSMTVLPIPGNHDDRVQLRRCFPDVLPSGGPDDTIDYVVDIPESSLRLVGLDTSVPGEHGGELSSTQLDWLEGVLSADESRPTLIFQHHPPFVTGIPHMDRVGLANADDERETVARHTNVEAIVSGHIHRSIQTRFATTIASCWPSTGAAIALNFLDGLPEYSAEPPGFAIHRFVAQEGLTSHVVATRPFDRWSPQWALNN
jgi:Icc protein